MVCELVARTAIHLSTTSTPHEKQFGSGRHTTSRSPSTRLDHAGMNGEQRDGWWRGCSRTGRHDRLRRQAPETTRLQSSNQGSGVLAGTTITAGERRWRSLSTVRQAAVREPLPAAQTCHQVEIRTVKQQDGCLREQADEPSETDTTIEAGKRRCMAPPGRQRQSAYHTTAETVRGQIEQLGKWKQGVVYSVPAVHSDNTLETVKLITITTTARTA